jgi:recombination protein RecA
MRSIEDVKKAIRLGHSELCDVLEDLSKCSTVEASQSTNTGIFSLDVALGGGLPSGAVEIYGGPSSGKTTLLYEILKQAQDNGFIVALCPTEYVDIPYAMRIGIDPNSLVIISSHCGDYALQEMTNFLLMHKNEKVLASFDSATNLRPKDDALRRWLSMLGSFLDSTPGLLSPSSCVVMTNQVRARPSVDPRNCFVTAEVDTAARKLVSQFSARMFLSKGDTKGGDKEMIVNIVSNTLSRPARILRLPFGKQGGVNKLLDLFKLSVDIGLVLKDGPWFRLGDMRLGPGLDRAVEQVAQNEALLRYDERLRRKLSEKLG